MYAFHSECVCMTLGKWMRRIVAHTEQHQANQMERRKHKKCVVREKRQQIDIMASLSSVEFRSLDFIHQLSARLFVWKIHSETLTLSSEQNSRERKNINVEHSRWSTLRWKSQIIQIEKEKENENWICCVTFFTCVCFRYTNRKFHLRKYCVIGSCFLNSVFHFSGWYLFNNKKKKKIYSLTEKRKQKK